MVLTRVIKHIHAHKMQSGGVSMGDKDLVKPLLEKRGKVGTLESYSQSLPCNVVALQCCGSYSDRGRLMLMLMLMHGTCADPLRESAHEAGETPHGACLFCAPASVQSLLL